MNKKTKVISLAVLILLIGNVFSFASPDMPKDLNENKMARANIFIEDKEDSSLFSKAGEAAAIQTAAKEYNQIGNNGVKVKHCLITSSTQMFSEESLEKDPALKQKGHMDKLPVYIVSFKTPPYHPAPDSKEDPIIDEVHIVIDALSGLPLMSFSYER